MTNSSDEDDIPLLDDIVSATSPDQAGDSPFDQIVETLMDDRWKQSYNDLLTRARHAISSESEYWSGNDPEQAETTLAVIENIHLTFESQIRETITSSLEQHINELRELLLHSLRDQLNQLPELLSEKEDDGFE